MKLENENFDKPLDTQLNIAAVSSSAFSQEEEDELQRLVRKIRWNHPTYDDMERADELTRKKWKSQGIG